MEIRIRPAELTDFQHLPEIESSADVLLEMPGLPAVSSSQEYQESLQTLVAEADGKLIGLARIEEVDGEAHLEQLSVRPEAAGQGAGLRQHEVELGLDGLGARVVMVARL
ncbi:N-acetylglutamate synthase-like GNAT family acetyltransferase [Psychromicrobium silvestre]|uniref:N-acetylglutamate synthase-like GNAT family acetyltransferase n=1 Tax=Psychromicrobium silvestre TaxID=1645614 RepID=A0A7Y9LS60_9MICC|nr:GNAT family N-acetyltransferase [Psychromicrobium silvestre]NYE94616.1 N-acetylglutamate synthase-like GNAT family acetyltransferase [Psychromicrobium silvestre]